MVIGSALLLMAALAADPAQLDGTTPLTVQGDIPMRMVAGINAYLDRALEESVEKRAALWHRDFSSNEAYTKSVDPNRQRLATIIGATDARDTPNLEVVSYLSINHDKSSDIPHVQHVRWHVFRGIEGEGILVEPTGSPLAQIVALPDCDMSPEDFLTGVSANSGLLPVASGAAQLGCRVIIPLLVNRADDYSGTPGIRMTNQPHREFVYRTGYELGRHIIGYEVQKVLAAIDALKARDDTLPIGVMGYGEGGLIALYAAALDTRINAAFVSGYFQPRESVWKEPIYRNVWSLLHEFGDAEVASLIAPRALFVEACEQPNVSGPPEPDGARNGAAPGQITTPSSEAVKAEVERARLLLAGLSRQAPIEFFDAGKDGALQSWARVEFLQMLRIDPVTSKNVLHASLTMPQLPDPAARMKRQVQQLIDDTQYLMHQAEFRRKEFWAKADASSPEAWAKSVEWYRTYFNEEAIGALPPIELPPNARTRLVYDQPTYRGYEVVLDVFTDVIAYGILLVPKNIMEGEKRPVVVCQHGLEGRVQDVADPSVDSPYYHQFACKLAEQGFVTYSPQNPYIGEDKFRVLQRKANPLKLSLFSFIVRQHEQTLNWLGSLPFVDAKRIAFYGLSYGGKTAMRVPALLDGYCLSICSGDYNEWIWKCASVHHPLSYIFTGEDEMWEWNMGNTFNHAEMSWLIYPRPFMVERGHFDGVGYDEWVAYEFAKTKRHYVLLGSGDDAEIEYFNGPHMINGVGTFSFLKEKLNWPGR
ncbi:MAG: hypothetical protein HUU46_13080 [Candidatus Hydrogenedentes bacterium]|nr:hypothetical protein [Candidatus Hydrogenedentota bacterium]